MLLGSIAAHGIVFAVLRLEWDAWVPAQVAVVTAPNVELVDVTPVAPPQTISVTVLADDPIAVRTPTIARSRGSVAIATPSGSSETANSVSPGEHAEPPKRSLGMRGPELHPGDEQLEHIADAPGHEPPSAVIPSKRLEEAPGGRATIHDAVTEISVDRDGTAHFHDKPDVEIHIDTNPFAVIQNFKDAGKAIAEWAEDPEAGKRASRTQDLAPHMQMLCSDAWGDPLCEDPESSASESAARKRGGAGILQVFGISGKFDITSTLMRKLGVGDAYAARKLKALDDTRLERAERGGRYMQQQLDHAAQLMQDNLERVWAATQDLGERKAALFELWDECSEGEGPTGEAGDRARKMVIGWIRAKLPEGTPAAFTPTELTELDQHRSSHQPFAPY